MAKKLILIHGRSQAGKDASALKQEWLDALDVGLGAIGETLPIGVDDVRFPYYGDTLEALTDDPEADDVPEIIVRGDGRSADSTTQRMALALIQETLQQQGIDDDAIRTAADDDVIERGPLSWQWIHKGLRLLDDLPGVSGATMALATNDVASYITMPGVRKRINDGVGEAFDALAADDEVVVVSHSLGTVVAYDMVALNKAHQDRPLPAFITIGSPLGMTAIRNAFNPRPWPPGAQRWLNAFDRRDVIALYPLDDDRFRVSPANPIENHDGVDNTTFNHHSISGYLSDPTIAGAIVAALT